ncbi:MAG TPA: hypothetical protein VIE43_08740 [Thermoanaerobaculia bacterium]|nr:hypothetical protein [Thermoanaerobaculia bacterium]
MRRARVHFIGAGAIAAGLLLAAAPPARGTQVKIFQARSQAAFLAGTLDGVSVDALGRMQLAPRVDRVASVSEPFLLAAAVHPDGWVVGTGNAGKVLKIDRKGAITELFAAPEPEVFAVWSDPDGTVYAGTSPKGKVYRIPPKGGKAEVFFDPQATYIWALARAADGSLLVGTGTEGKLYKVSAKGKGTVLYDSDDTHIRALAPLPGGDVLVGTSGEGLILRVSPDGKARTLYDAQQPEVVSLVVAPDGTCYAGLIASEASLVDQARDQAAAAPPAATAPGRAKGGAAQPQVSVAVEPVETPTVRAGRKGAAGAAAPRSEVLAISPSGVVESLWTFADDTIYDLLYQNGQLWVATGLEGKLYRWADQQMLLEKDVDERQIVAVLPGDPGPVFATTNAAALFRVTRETETSGIYTSPALDAEQVARFGTFSWQGDLPAGAAVRVSFRSGVSAEPDRTWSAWTEPREGKEIALAGVPKGRFVQFRVELKAGGSSAGPAGSPRLYETELSYRQENLKPKIAALQVLDPGQILVPANFNPGNQIYEPAHPNREGIFNSLAPAPDDEGARSKVLWKLGYQTLRWMANDPNGDDLVYDLSFRPASPEGGKEGDWLQVVKDLKEDHYSFDASSLPDGIFRFRLRASDLPSNDPDAALVAERVSDPVVIDHTPPELVKVEKDHDGKLLRVTVRDALSPLREAVVSVNAQEWKPVRTADGLLDARTETLLIEPGKPGDLVLLRVTDAAHNVITFNVTSER